MPSRTSSSRRPFLWRGLGLAAGALLLLAIIGIFGVKWAIGRYIESEAFRRMAGRNAGPPLGATVDFSAFHLQGANLSSDGLSARGRPDSPLAEFEIQSIRAEWSLRRLLDRVCQLDAVELGRATLRLKTSAPPGPAAATSLSVEPSAKMPSEPPGFWAGFLPNRVAVGSVSLEHGQVSWEGGKAQDLTFEATAEERGASVPEWKIIGRGGAIAQAGLPGFELKSFRLRYRQPTVYVEDVQLHQASGGQGVLSAEGEISTPEEYSLQVKGQRLPIDLLLPADWLQHLHGALSGEADFRPAHLEDYSPEVTGTWKLSDDARLEALPMLEQLALFTNTDQFRHLPLTRAGGRFRAKGGRLEFTEIVAESAGLARLEGRYTQHGEQIDGDLQLGIVASLLQWLPGTRTKLFAVSRDGYIWTPVHLSGTLSHPREDLSTRLVTGLAGEVVETATGLATDAAQAAKAAASGNPSEATKAAGEIRQKAEETAKGLLDRFLK